MVPSLTIIVPFYNEARTLNKLVKEIEELPRNVYEQVIFVNDGSNDKSEQILQAALVASKIPHVYMYKSNGGKASAVMWGLEKANTTHAVILDADLELKVSDLSKLWNVIVSGEADAVFGYRNFKSHSSYTYRYAIGNRFISNFYGIVFNELVTDIMCGYKLFPVSTKVHFPRRISGYAIEIAIPSALLRKGIKPYEIEVSYKPRNRHEGKIINSFDAMKVMFAIIKFRMVVRANNN